MERTEYNCTTGEYKVIQLTQAEIDALPAPPIPTVTEIIIKTKAEAQRRILAVIPQWKQANLTARGVELNTKVISGGVLTTAEQAELTAGFALWSKAKAIRTASDLIEQDIAASINLATFDVVNSARWPV